jgi:hypothetical protein
MPPLPKPRLVFRIGIVGHREHHLDDEHLDIVRQRIQEALDVVVSTLTAIAEDEQFGYRNAVVIRAVASLAEGADRIAVREFLDRTPRCEFDCVLPLSATEFSRDFSTMTSRMEFTDLLGQARNVIVLDGVRREGQQFAEARAYEAAGTAILQNCDVLLALWDGEASLLVGGTYNTVRLAALYGIPIIHVHTVDDNALSLVIVEGGEIVDRVGIAELGDRIRDLVLPAPEPPNAVHRQSDIRDELFRGVVPVRRKWERVYEMFTDWLLERDVEAPQSTKIARPDDALERQLHEGLNPVYEIANDLAEAYGRRYRSAFTLLYMLAFGAVLFAVLAFAVPHWFEGTTHHTALKWAVAGIGLAELFALAFIFLLFRRARSRRWHERWMDYRAVAEQIRQHRFLLPVARTSGVMTVPKRAGVVDVTTTWVDWIVRSVVREVGLLRVDLTDPAQLGACWRVLRDEELADQIAYHERRQEDYEKLCAKLEGTAQWLFVVATIVCIGHLWHHDWTGFSVVAVLAPATGAAIHGFLVQGGFAMLHSRSVRIGAQLKLLKHELDEVERLSARNRARVPSRALSLIAESAAATMAGELTDWRGYTGSRPVMLPS